MNSTKTKFYIESSLKPITPRQCGRQECAPGYSFGPFTRDFWILHFVTCGKGYFTNSHGTVEITQNQVFIIRPYEITSYTADKDDPWTYIWIGFSTELPVPLPIVLNDAIYAPELRDIFLLTYNTLEANAATSVSAFEHFLCGSVWQIFGILKRGEEKTHTTADGYVNAAINIMKYEFHTSITVTEIKTDKIGLEEYYIDLMKEARR